MLKSMTGYGRAEIKEDARKAVVEIRTLNSKYLDVNAKLPKTFLSKEIEIKNITGKRLFRGKVTVILDFEKTDDNTQLINEGLFQKLVDQLSGLAKGKDVADHQLFQLALQAPGVMDAETDESISDEDWKVVQSALNSALANCEKYRSDEGSALQLKLEEYIESISKQLDAVTKKDPERVEAIRKRLQKHVADLTENEKWDENRFEQELVYYIEKLDIQEELVRLSTHLKYFKEVINESKDSAGKKLGFISQEIGREINTIGSKANDADIQRNVVVMKEELEKIKEQLLNVV